MPDRVAIPEDVQTIIDQIEAGAARLEAERDASGWTTAKQEYGSATYHGAPRLIAFIKSIAEA